MGEGRGAGEPTVNRSGCTYVSVSSFQWEDHKRWGMLLSRVPRKQSFFFQQRRRKRVALLDNGGGQRREKEERQPFKTSLNTTRVSKLAEAARGSLSSARRRLPWTLKRASKGWDLIAHWLVFIKRRSWSQPRPQERRKGRGREKRCYFFLSQHFSRPSRVYKNPSKTHTQLRKCSLRRNNGRCEGKAARRFAYSGVTPTQMEIKFNPNSRGSCALLHPRLQAHPLPRALVVAPGDLLTQV